jgi:hypothetical protein
VELHRRQPRLRRPPLVRGHLTVRGVAEPVLIRRASFGIAAVFGGITTVRLVSIDRNVVRGPFRRFRWAVVVLYGLILVFAVAPALAQLVGLTPLQAASIGLILLVDLAHGITWEFMMETPIAPKDA